MLTKSLHSLVIWNRTILALMLLSSGVLAEDACQGATPLELSECLESRYREQDSTLNATYRQVMAQINTAYTRSPDLGTKLKEQLKKMQKQWIAARDEHCLFVSQVAAVDAPSTGNQLHQSTFAGIACKTEYTRERVRALQEILTSLNNR